LYDFKKLDRSIRDLKIGIEELNKKIDKVIAIHTDIKSIDMTVDIFDLPFHLQTSIRAVYKFIELKNKSSTAVDIANITGKARAIESNYLNQLVRLGWLIKERKRRMTFFYPRKMV